MKKRGLSCLLVFSIVSSLISFSNVSADSDQVEKLHYAIDNVMQLPDENTVSIFNVPDNIKNLITDQKADKIILASDSQDETEMFTLRTINSETGQGTITVHSVPIKYIDSAGNMQFIDTSMKPIAAAKSKKSDFIYRNAANSFLVEFGNTASKGINFNNAFTFEANSNIASKTNQSQAGQVQTVNGQGKIIYPNVFGTNTKIEYINTENGLKENIILEKYTGQNRFDFTFRSETHVPILTENGTNILVANKNDPSQAEYKFLSLYAYDSYDPVKDSAPSDTDFRHMNESLYYELTDEGNGVYTITVVVPKDYLTHPEIVYPVTIDPSLTPHVSNNGNAHDTFVDAATPSEQNNGDLDYIRFGKVSGYKNFGYHRFTSLPSLPKGAYVTSAYLKFTFRSGQTTPAANSKIQMRVRQITGNTWYESSITWNTKPSTTSSTLVDISYNGSYLDYFDANITNIVKAWYSNSPNYGIDFTYSNEDYNDHNSVVSSEGEAHRAPVLSVNYTMYGVTSGISSGQTYYIKNVYSGKYLDAEQSLNNNVIQYTYHGNSNQQWRVVYQSNGLYKFYNHYSFYSNGKYCLDLAGLSNNNIDLYNNVDGDYVLFNILPNGDGTYRIQNYWPKGNAVLTVSDSSSPSNVYNSTWTGSSKQKWVFETRASKALRRLLPILVKLPLECQQIIMETPGKIMNNVYMALESVRTLQTVSGTDCPQI